MIVRRDLLKVDNPQVNFSNVSFSWPEQKETIISNCNFSINNPGLWMIVGENGSGKSTFFKLISGILQPDKGHVNCMGNIGMVFQNPDHQILMPTCRSELLINTIRDISEKEINAKIEYVLDKVGLTGFAKRPVYTLSGGQKQRLAIASALIGEKNLILLDEPTALLDRTSQLRVLEIIKNLTSDNEFPLIAMWVTHRYEELSFADAVAEMRNGALSEWEKPSNYQYN